MRIPQPSFWKRFLTPRVCTRKWRVVYALHSAAAILASSNGAIPTDVKVSVAWTVPLDGGVAIKLVL
jgi:hypothetical protein